MADVPAVFSLETVVRRIQEFRGQRVMLDADLALLYGVETRQLIQVLKRNPERFPEDFMFQLDEAEWELLKSQDVISKGRGGRRYAPYVFTEHGALMLSSVLKSERAVEVSLLVIRAFVWLRQNMPAYEELAVKLKELETAVKKHDESMDVIFKALAELIDASSHGRRDEERKRLGYLR